MGKRVLHTRWIRRLLIVILVMVMLGVGMKLMFAGFLRKNNITYTTLDYQFPATLLVTDFSMLRGDSIGVDVSIAEVEWKWRPLLKKQLEITRLVIDDAAVVISSRGSMENSQKKKTIPAFNLNQVRLTNFRLNAALNKDTLQLLLPELALSGAGFNAQFFVDSLLLQRAEVHFFPDTTMQQMHPGNKRITFDQFPLARIQHISINSSSLHLQNPRMDHEISNLNLVFNGLKKSDMANFSLDRLGLTYQDTLDLQFIMEDGTINNQLFTRLNNINFISPGVNINIAETTFDLRDHFTSNIIFQSSYFTAGIIRQWLPGAAGILHPDLPAATRISFEGNLIADTGMVSLFPLSVSLLDSTSITLSGEMHFAPVPAVELLINPLRTSRSNLQKILSPRDYNQFYHWPIDIMGTAKIHGAASKLRVKGIVGSRQGRMDIAAEVNRGNNGQSSFTLDISSDSLRVNQVTSLLPFEIPLGQIQLNLKQQERPESLHIAVKSDWLQAFDQEVHNLAFSYSTNAAEEYIQASARDEVMEFDLGMHTPIGKLKQGPGGTESAVMLQLHRIQPGAFRKSLPEGIVSGTFRGNISSTGKERKAEIEVYSAMVISNNDSIIVPDSEISLLTADSDIELMITSKGSRILHGHSGKTFPPFSMPLDQWIAAWPGTDLEMNFMLGEDIIKAITGTSGKLVLDSARIHKDSLNFNASLNIPEALFGDKVIDGLAIDLVSSPGNFSGQMDFGSIASPAMSIDSFSVDVGYAGDDYAFLMRFNGNDSLSHNSVSMRMNRQSYGYNLHFSNEEPLIISNRQFDLLANDGLKFGKDMKLLGGTLGIGSGSMKLEVSSTGEYVSAAVDSFQVFSMMKPFEGVEIDNLMVSGFGEVNTLTADASLKAEVLAHHAREPEPVKLKVEGLKKAQQISGTIQVIHPDINAGINLLKNEKVFAYSSDISMVKPEIFQRLIPGWPKDLELEGQIMGKVTGMLQPGFSSEGYVVADQLSVQHSMLPTSIFIQDDTLRLTGKRLEFSDFQFTDDRGSQLMLNGAMEYTSEPKFDLNLSGEHFSLIHSTENSARLRGDLEARVDLGISGDLKNVAVTGSVETLPEGNVTYRNEKSFAIVDASHIVTFMDLDDEADEADQPVAIARTDLDLDVLLAIKNTTLEVLLDQISGEYIELYGSGDLRIRTGPGNTPQVFGTIRSSTGRAYIQPSPLPELDVTINQAEATWSGAPREPLISFRGFETVNAPASRLSVDFYQRTDVINYTIEVILDKVTLSEFDIQFDLSSSDADAAAYLASLSRDKRQAYAINLLVFGRIGTEKLPANSLVANQVTQKLNEVARRNLKNTGIRFSSETYRESTDAPNGRERTDLNYAISRRFLDNRLSFKIGGSVGLYTDDMTELPPSELIGDLEISYKLSEQPSLILKGKRKNAFEGILDGMVTEESLGIYFQKSYPSVKDMFERKKEAQAE